jgi:hypothetical protein
VIGWSLLRTTGPIDLMSKRERYDEAKQLLSEIQHELATQPLTAKQRSELEIHAARLAGAVLHPWFPMSWTRRTIMVAIVLVGMQQAWVGNYQPLIWWLLLPVFSPRLVGECTFVIGKLRRSFDALR